MATDEQAQAAAIRPQYEAEGVDEFYRRAHATYRNPHEAAVRLALDHAVDGWALNLARVLDLACGSGEVTLALRRHTDGRIDGADPFTGDAYLARTGQTAEPLSFADVAAGALDGRRFTLIVCSYALHLCEGSRLPSVAIAMTRATDSLLILSPHKRPVIEPAWGWRLDHAEVVERVHVRLYRTR